MKFFDSRLTGNRGMKYASDCDSNKNEYLTSWRPETDRKFNYADVPSISSRSFVRSRPEEMSADIQHNYSVLGDPRLPSAEGFSLCCLLLLLNQF